MFLNLSQENPYESDYIFIIIIPKSNFGQNVRNKTGKNLKKI